MRTEELTKGEALEIERRRAGLNQKDMAALLGVAHNRYKRFERGELVEEAPDLDVGELSGAEWCRLQRRRRGLTHAELAELSGFAAKWIHRAERGETRDVSPLVAWWEDAIR